MPSPWSSRRSARIQQSRLAAAATHSYAFAMTANTSKAARCTVHWHSLAARLVQTRVKVKHRSLLDGIVGAVIGPVARPEEIVVGRYAPDGALRIVGRSTPLNSQQSKELAAVLIEVPGGGPPMATGCCPAHSVRGCL